jgi:hypothetical protein
MNKSVEENQRLKRALAQRKQRDIEIKRKLTEAAATMQEALKTSEESTRMLQELLPGLDNLQVQLTAELARWNGALSSIIDEKDAGIFRGTFVLNQLHHMRESMQTVVPVLSFESLDRRMEASCERRMAS